jgi:predicted metal-dependent phosphoesterase TrpH
MHTNLSDGTDTTQELLAKVESIGLDVFSITDHDDIESNEIALSTIQQRKFDAKFVTGCEISTIYNNFDIHLLFYNFDIKDDCISQLLKKMKTLRTQRNFAMFEHLKSVHNIVFDEDVKSKLLQRKILGKVHFANAILKQDASLIWQQIFDNFLNDMDDTDFRIQASTVFEMLKDAKGVVSLAHPIEIQEDHNLNFEQLFKLIKNLKDLGLVSLEVYHNKHTQRHIMQYSKIADELSLKVSAGSDYHGTNKKVALGQVTADGSVPSSKQITILNCF